MEREMNRILLGDDRRVTFRPVTADDERFLLVVYTSARMAELEMTGWNEAQREAFIEMQFQAQCASYEQNYPEGEHSIILVNGQQVGRLYLARREKRIHILDITILPEHRNAGTGTAILADLMGEAAGAGKAVSIYVESFNPSLLLFERLGFVKTGESGYSFLMEWRS